MRNSQPRPARALNNSDFAGLVANEHLLDDRQQELLSVWQMRKSESPYIRRHADYDARAGLVLMSSWSGRHPFIWCGHPEKRPRKPGGKRRRWLCHAMRLCPRCNYVFRVKKLFRRFDNDSAFFRARGWWFVTLGYTSNPANGLRFLADDVEPYLESTEATGVFDYTGRFTPAPLAIVDAYFEDEQRLLYWDVAHQAVRRFRACRLIDGYLAADDMFVKFGHGAGILPHVHCVLTAERFSQSMVEELGDSVDRQLDLANPQIRLHSSIKVYRIKTPDHLRRLMRYVVKPVDFVSPYQLAVECADARNPDGSLNVGYMAALNQQVSDFFHAATCGMYLNRRGFRLGGELYPHPRTGYIGKRLEPATQTRPRRPRSPGISSRSKQEGGEPRETSKDDNET